jgi:hypothetical protein
MIPKKLQPEYYPSRFFFIPSVGDFEMALPFFNTLK